jgi:hypothetical protein
MGSLGAAWGAIFTLAAILSASGRDQARVPVD